MFCFRKILVLIGIAAFAGCQSGKSTENDKKIDLAINEDTLMAVHQRLNKQEAYLIAQYVKRHNLDVTKTGTGTLFDVYESGDGVKIDLGDRITLGYKVYLLNGKLCYDSEKRGDETVLVGRDNVETGLHEVAQFLRNGDKVIVILPAHRAFGLMGDGAKIPEMSTVVYKLEIKNVIKGEFEKK